ncbi:hypothetical protein J40TS1_14080 [Paenibacillus montaniterrae]|uniref:Dehydrogenase n=1 Tax=Paenibacillus montaniterrae TaxID=429341 RepID=A0A919YP85_9BACL|nr:dehydrogenase [Paenibacillus montaniterrae]GIP15766.1 hypothetical protein J40TS1_14080 [Paenibacillus montaniterrae]
MKHQAKNQQPELPKARNIRRTCQSELYRAIKRMKVWIPEDKVKAAEKLYFQKVAANLVWIHENRSNRQKQLEWWEAHVCDELVAILEVDRQRFADAFKDAYGG